MQTKLLLIARYKCGLKGLVLGAVFGVMLAVTAAEGFAADLIQSPDNASNPQGFPVSESNNLADTNQNAVDQKNNTALPNSAPTDRTIAYGQFYGLGEASIGKVDFGEGYHFTENDVTKYFEQIEPNGQSSRFYLVEPADGKKYQVYEREYISLTSPKLNRTYWMLYELNQEAPTFQSTRWNAVPPLSETPPTFRKTLDRFLPSSGGSDANSESSPVKLARDNKARNSQVRPKELGARGEGKKNIHSGWPRIVKDADEYRAEALPQDILSSLADRQRMIVQMITQYAQDEEKLTEALANILESGLDMDLAIAALKLGFEDERVKNASVIIEIAEEALRNQEMTEEVREEIKRLVTDIQTLRNMFRLDLEKHKIDLKETLELLLGMYAKAESSERELFFIILGKAIVAFELEMERSTDDYLESTAQWMDQLKALLSLELNVDVEEKAILDYARRMSEKDIQDPAIEGKRRRLAEIVKRIETTQSSFDRSVEANKSLFQRFLDSLLAQSDFTETYKSQQRTEMLINPAAAFQKK